jgi:hypothetical protein
MPREPSVPNFHHSSKHYLAERPLRVRSCSWPEAKHSDTEFMVQKGYIVHLHIAHM